MREVVIFVGSMDTGPGNAGTGGRAGRYTSRRPSGDLHNVSSRLEFIFPAERSVDQGEGG